MSPRSTCTAEKLVQSPNPAQPDSMHALHARCSQPMGHRGLHEGEDPFDPTHRILWDGAGEVNHRYDVEEFAARLARYAGESRARSTRDAEIGDLRGQIERLELALAAEREVSAELAQSYARVCAELAQ